MKLENFPTSPAGKRMISYVSEEFYERSYVGKWLYQVMGLEWDEVLSIAESLPEQLFPETATWAIMYHEIKYGLPIGDYMDLAERRRLIFIKRDTRAPMNPYYMEQSLSTIISGEATVLDSNEDHTIPPNTFVVKIDEVDDESVMRQVRAFLDRVKQSHTTYTILFYANATAKEYFYTGYVAELIEDSCLAIAY